jgi:fluoroquinolone transport system permease protein
MTGRRASFTGLLKTEMALQFRNGLYLIYLILTAFFLIIVALVPPSWRESALEIVIFLDPTFIGFFFAGGLILLEREQGVLRVVATTVDDFRSYARPKVAALLLLAGTVTALLILAATLLGFVRPTLPGTLRLIFGLVLSIPVFFNLGIIVAAWKPRVLEYFVYASIALLPLMVPLVDLVGVSTGIIGKVSPVWGAMTLITSVFAEGVPLLPLAGAAGSLLIWNVLTARWASRALLFLAGSGSRKVGSGTRTGAPGTPEAEARRGGSVGLSGAAVDVRLMLRDPVVALMLAAPLLAAVVLGRIIPLAVTTLGGDSVLPALAGRFLDNVRSFALLLGVVMYGVVGAFLILDEKDGGVIPFLKTVPGRPGWYILRRGRMLLLLHLAMVVPTVVAGNLFHGTPFRFVLSVLVDAAILPVVYLAVAIIAENKVQGLAAAKIINLLTLPPLLLMAIPEGWAWAVGVFPSAWGSLIRLHASTPVEVAGAAVVGVVYGGTAAVLLYRRLTGTVTATPG